MKLRQVIYLTTRYTHSLIRELMAQSPNDIDLSTVKADLLALPYLTSVKKLHVWQNQGGTVYASCLLSGSISKPTPTIQNILKAHGAQKLKIQFE